MHMTCTVCGKVGNEEDLLVLGEECPDEDGGTVITWQPVAADKRHPVDDLSQVEFDSCAAAALNSLRDNGYAFVDLSPGDATRYRIHGW